MPRSFLVKKCKRVSPFGFSKKAHQQVINEQNNENYRVEKLIRGNQSAFVSFSSKFEAVNEADLQKQRTYKEPHSTVKSTGKLFVPSSSPLKRAEGFRFSSLGGKFPQIEPVAVIYNEDERQSSPETEKENHESNKSEGMSSVTGPLSQSTFLCQLCKKVFQDAFSLAQHKCSGIKHVEHRCPECDKVFSCPANLASHRRWHRPRSPGSNKPLKLQKRIPSAESNSQSASEETSSSEEGRELKIVSAGEEKSDTTGFKNDQNVSSDEPSSPIDQNNNEVTDDKSGLSTEDSKYKCEQCGKGFKRPAYLRKHMNYHNNTRPYPCQYCGKIFRSLTNRAKHVLEHAVGPKAFSCSTCGNGFANKSGLDKHARIHNGEVFSCSECSVPFYSVPGLQQHISKTHTSVIDSH